MNDSISWRFVCLNYLKEKTKEFTIHFDIMVQVVLLNDVNNVYLQLLSCLYDVYVT